MAAAVTTEVFNCSVEQFFNLLIDFESYAQFIPEVQSSKIIKTEGNRKLVEFEVNLIKQIKYRLWLTEHPPNKVTWLWDSGDVFKDQKGHWILSDDGGKARAEYSLDAKLGLFVPSMFTKKILETNLPGMMKAYHQRVTELYG